MMSKDCQEYMTLVRKGINEDWKDNISWQNVMGKINDSY